jgi:hypothetical protein
MSQIRDVNADVNPRPLLLPFCFAASGSRFPGHRGAALCVCEPPCTGGLFGSHPRAHAILRCSQCGSVLRITTLPAPGAPPHRGDACGSGGIGSHSRLSASQLRRANTSTVVVPMPHMTASPPLSFLCRTDASERFGRYLFHSRSLRTHNSSSWQFAIPTPPEWPQVIMRFVFPTVMIPLFIGAPR